MDGMVALEEAAIAERRRKRLGTVEAGIRKADAWAFIVSLPGAPGPGARLIGRSWCGLFLG
jgi:hypothetical protein